MNDNELRELRELWEKLNNAGYFKAEQVSDNYTVRHSLSMDEDFERMKQILARFRWDDQKIWRGNAD